MIFLPNLLPNSISRNWILKFLTSMLVCFEFCSALHNYCKLAMSSYSSLILYDLSLKIKTKSFYIKVIICLSKIIFSCNQYYYHHLISTYIATCELNYCIPVIVLDNQLFRGNCKIDDSKNFLLGA